MVLTILLRMSTRSWGIWNLTLPPPHQIKCSSHSLSGVLISFFTLSLLIPARVICWQSYSSILSKLWQLFRCSREASVIKGQLSSSITSKRSCAQAPFPKWRIPSSVISSQWDKLCIQTQQVSSLCHRQREANTLPGDTVGQERRWPTSHRFGLVCHTGFWDRSILPPCTGATAALQTPGAGLWGPPMINVPAKGKLIAEAQWERQLLKDETHRARRQDGTETE